MSLIDRSHYNMKKTFFLCLLLVACGSEKQVKGKKRLYQKQSLNPITCPLDKVKDKSTGACRHPRRGYYVHDGKETSCKNIPNKLHFTTHGGTSPKGCHFECRSGYEKNAHTRTCTKNTLNKSLDHCPQNKLSIDYNWNTCPTHLRASIERAFRESMEIWNSISGSSLQISAGQSLNMVASEVYDGHRIIPFPSPHVAIVICDENYGRNSSSDSHQETIKMGTTFLRIRKPMYIQYSAMILNTNGDLSLKHLSISYERILALLVHEMGHIIGIIDHDPDENSVMNAIAEQITLSEKDKNKIIARYPE